MLPVVRLRHERGEEMSETGNIYIAIEEMNTVIVENEILRKELENYEEIAPCGHPNKFWKVEVNEDAWCLQCAVEKLAIEGNELRKQLEALNTMHDIAIAERNTAWKRLSIAVEALGHYANDNNWFKTPTLTKWKLNPDAPLLAKNALAKIKEVEK